jgi:hypothetical protein
MAFSRKFINVTIKLQNGGLNGGVNKATIKDHRVGVAIEQNGSPDAGKATCSIYGLPLTTMNQLTQLPYMSEAVGNNSILIEAGGDDGVAKKAFAGTIFAAFADIHAPIAALRIDAMAGLYNAIAPAKPMTAQGSQDVAQLLGQIAKQGQLTLENNGVSCQIRDQYLPGSNRQQIKRLAEAAGINWLIENDTLAIWPKNGSRNSGPSGTPTISKKTGMVGYPRYTASGIEVVTLWNPNLIYGGSVKVESDLTPACGTWYIVNIAHELECETPNGKWFTILSCSRLQV